MTDSNQSEQLDGDALGEQPSDHDLPGVNAFTDDTNMQSEDPSLVAGGSETRDDERTRTWREVPEPGASTGDDPDADDRSGDLVDGAPDPGIDLVDDPSVDTGSVGALDDEPRLVADRELQEHRDPAPEVTAIHEIPPSETGSEEDR